MPKEVINNFNNGVRNEIQETNLLQTKIPELMGNESTWFLQLESIFQISKITSEQTKFLHLVSNIPTNTLKKFENYLSNESSSPYTDLKKAMINDKKQPKSRTFEKLIELTLGERSPSSLLREMKSLLQEIENQTTIPEGFLKEAFLHAIPESIRHHLVNYESQTLEEIAKKADRHVELSNSTEMHTIRYKEPNELHELREEIAELRSKLKENPKILCFYHQKYREEARKCVQPCFWKSGKEQGSPRRQEWRSQTTKDWQKYPQYSQFQHNGTKQQ